MHFGSFDFSFRQHVSLKSFLVSYAGQKHLSSSGKQQRIKTNRFQRTLRTLGFNKKHGLAEEQGNKQD